MNISQIHDSNYRITQLEIIDHSIPQLSWIDHLHSKKQEQDIRNLFLAYLVVCGSLVTMAMYRVFKGVQRNEMQQLRRFDGVTIFQVELFLFLKFSIFNFLIGIVDGIIGMFAIENESTRAIQLLYCWIVGRNICLLIGTLIAGVINPEYTLMLYMDYFCQGITCIGFYNTICVLGLFYSVLMQFGVLVFLYTPAFS